MKRFVLIALLVTTASHAADRKDAWKAARPAGQAEACLQLQQIRETRVRDDQTIDFYLRNRKVYRNTLPAPCPQLKAEQRFSYSTNIQQLCYSDTITVLPVGAPQMGPTCGLGRFQPVTGVER